MPHPEVILLGCSVPWIAFLSGTSVLQGLEASLLSSHSMLSLIWGISLWKTTQVCSGSEQLRRTQHGEATTAIGTGEDGITAWH